VERFNLRKLNVLEVRKQCKIEFTNGFEALHRIASNSMAE
jgi:hypothetical protein